MIWNIWKREDHGRIVRWHYNKIEFCEITKNNDVPLVRTVINLPCIDGQIVYRPNLMSFHMKTAHDWLDRGILPSQPV
jgi:hypothetical protein